MTSLKFSFLELEMEILRAKLQGYKSEKDIDQKPPAVLEMWEGSQAGAEGKGGKGRGLHKQNPHLGHGQ